jgi:bacillithiol system protein YtxJ
MFPWNQISNESHIDLILEQSLSKTQVIFKHSTRCSISSVALGRVERSTPADSVDYHLLDLIAHRDISNLIAEQFSVFHESPQVLIIKDKLCIEEESHMAIDAELIEKYA